MSVHLSCALLLLLPGGGPKAGGYPRPELLIEAAELARPEVAKEYRILDARPRAKYLAGHVPDAVWVDHATWAKAFAAGQDPKEWAQRLGTLGLAPKGAAVPVGRQRGVAYDDRPGEGPGRRWGVCRFSG